MVAVAVAAIIHSIMIRCAAVCTCPSGTYMQTPCDGTAVYIGDQAFDNEQGNAVCTCEPPANPPASPPATPRPPASPLTIST